MISNSWDAYANTVKINWPNLEGLKEGNEKFTILDDGHGMTENEFIEKWSQIGHDKTEHKVELKKFDDGREIVGKNGRGRLGLFCFTDQYVVSTSKDNVVSSFKVIKTVKDFAKIIKIDPLWNLLN